MKKVTTFIAVIALSITIFSCTKSTSNSSSSTTQPPQPKLQCYENGVLCNYDAVWDSSLGWINYPRFNNLLDSMNGYQLQTDLPGFMSAYDTSTKGIQFILPYDKPLSLGSVNIIGFNIWKWGSPTVGFDMWNKGNGVITITRLSKGSADGTFSCVLLSGSPSQYPNLNITQGQFSNIPVLTY